MLRECDLLIICRANSGYAFSQISLLDSLTVTRVNNLTEAEPYIENHASALSIIITETIFLPGLISLLRKTRYFEDLDKPSLIVLIESSSQRDEMLLAGADDYFLVPINPIEVNRRLSHILRIGKMQENHDEEQTHTAEIAFLVLLSRLIGEQLDLDIILSRSLEQSVNLLNASCGDIWLLSEENQYLVLASSLSQSQFPIQRDSRRLKGQGLFGKAIGQTKPLLIKIASQDPWFDPQLDRICQVPDRSSVLLVNLNCHGHEVGLLALYKTNTDPFTIQDSVLLENISPFVATAIVNAQLLQTTRDSADNHRLFFEMNQQLTSSLDIHLMLLRAIQWIGRLTNIDLGVIWLVDESQKNLQAMAGVGIELPQKGLIIPFEKFNSGRMSVTLNSPSGDSECLNILIEALQIKPQNGLILPIEQNDQIIGLVSLFNKFNHPFSQADIKLLKTATDIISTNIRNAQLHARTILLMEEREKLHGQAIQNERLRTIGLLAASLAHEINNPMQAIRGALALALEDLENKKEIEEYIRLSQHEADRVVKLVNRMRQLYRPSVDSPGSINLTILLNEILEICAAECLQREIRVICNIPSELPVIVGSASQLQLALLSIFLYFINQIGLTGGGEISIIVYEFQDTLRVEFLIKTPLAGQNNTVDAQPTNRYHEIDKIYLDLFPSVDIIRANLGKLDVLDEDDQTLLRIQWPKA